MCLVFWFRVSNIHVSIYWCACLSGLQLRKITTVLLLCVSKSVVLGALPNFRQSTITFSIILHIFEYSGPLGCCAVLLCELFLLFWWITVPTSSGWSSPENMRNYSPSDTAVTSQETCVFGTTNVVVILFIVFDISGRVSGLVPCCIPTDSAEVCWGLILGFVPHTVDISYFIVAVCLSVHSPYTLSPFISVILNFPYNWVDLKFW